MLVDPRSKRILSVVKQDEPENNKIKAESLLKIISLYPKLDCFIHDRACGFEKYGRKLVQLKQIIYYSLDRFHGRMHKNSCKNKIQNNKVLEKRLNGINTSISEQIFSWFKRYAKTFNNLSTTRHHFLVLYFSHIHNVISSIGQLHHLNAFSTRRKNTKKANLTIAAKFRSRIDLY